MSSAFLLEMNNLSQRVGAAVANRVGLGCVTGDFLVVNCFVIYFFDAGTERRNHGSWPKTMYISYDIQALYGWIYSDFSQINVVTKNISTMYETQHNKC